MKALTRVVASVVLVLCLSIGALAGDMQGPGYVPPTPPLTTDSVTGETSTQTYDATTQEEPALEDKDEFSSFLMWLMALIF